METESKKSNKKKHAQDYSVVPSLKYSQYSNNNLMAFNEPQREKTHSSSFEHKHFSHYTI